MFVKPGDTVRFACFYQSSSTGLGVSGLTVSVNVNRGTTNAVNAGSATALDATYMPGWYSYDYVVPGGYYGILTAYFTTSDTSVSQRGAASFYLSAPWVEYLDAAITSRLASASYSAPPAAATIADAVWDEAISGHLTSGTTGAQLNAAGAAGDPLTNAVPGSYAAGSAGYLLGTLNTREITVISPFNAHTGKITVRDGDAYVAGNANGLIPVPSAVTLTDFDLSEIKLSVKRAEDKFNRGAALFTVTATAKTANEARFALTGANKRKLKPGGKYVYDAQVGGDDEEVTFAAGEWEVLPDVTP